MRAAILVHAILGIARETLINPNYRIGTPEQLSLLGYSGTERGLVVTPSPFGVELFLFAMGNSWGR